MKPELLQKCFSSITVTHIAALWEWVVSGVNQFLWKMDYKISWQYEGIHIAFKTLEEAPLVALLSEGTKHPTDGNDILFLLIIYFVSSYQWHNQHLQWFCWFIEFMNSNNSVSIQEQEVNLKFIATGCRGAVSMSSMVPFHPSELSALVTSCWIQGNGSYHLNAQKPGKLQNMLFFHI